MRFRIARIPTRRPANRRAARPMLEGLEDRKLLYATLGDAWTMPVRVTYSFVPDGTDIVGVPSEMYSKMSQQGVPTATWQQAFQQAAAMWEAVANINLVQVSDNGASDNTLGNQQGDSRFGDIRISEISLGNGAMALTFEPPPANGGPIAGDIIINSDYNWNSMTGYDLGTVAIHEFGHALGMDHSAYSYADMYAYYNTTKTSLSADDIAGIQSIYGTRPPDAFDAALNNGVPANATNLNPYFVNGQATFTNLSISNNSDADWYKITVPSGTNGTMTATMQSSGLSSLNPRLYLHNSSYGIISTTYVPGAYGATISLTLNGVLPGQVYYVRCTSAAGGVTGVGAYGLQLNFVGGSMAPIAPPNTAVAEQPDGQGGTTYLEPQHPGASGGPLANPAEAPPVNLPARAFSNPSSDRPGKPSAYSSDRPDGDDHFITVGNTTARGDFLRLLPGYQPSTTEDWAINPFGGFDDGGPSVPLVTADIQALSPSTDTAQKTAKDRNHA